MKILDGRKVAKEIEEKLEAKVSAFDIKPSLIIVQVGNNEASNKYINFKTKTAERIGIVSQVVKFAEDVEEQVLLDNIEILCDDADGLIVQLPLPAHIDKDKVLNSIPHDKDVDGLATGNQDITPATPRGIMSLLDFYGYELSGKTVGVIGQSNLVGKPVSDLCEQRGATVLRFDKDTTIAGSENADVLIVAAGQPYLVKKENIKEDVVIIDVGINTIGSKYSMTKITGDVDRESVGEIPSAISPVPGGVGPMTVISLMQNLVDTYEK